MDDPKLFDQEQDQTPPVPDPDKAKGELEQGSNETRGEYLDRLVGEGKKFKTVEDLARGKYEADAYVERLTKEQEELRQELEKRVGLEEKLDSLLKAQEGRDRTPSDPPAGKQVDDLDLDKLIEGKLSEREKAHSEQAMFRDSQKAVIDHFGGDVEQAKAFVAKRAQELGVTTEYLGSRAKESKQAFMALVGIQARPEQRQTDRPRGTHTDVPVNHQGAKPGSKQYYDQLRRENPRLYFSAKTQQEIFKAAAANPDDWR